MVPRRFIRVGWSQDPQDHDIAGHEVVRLGSRLGCVRAPRVPSSRAVRRLREHARCVQKQTSPEGCSGLERPGNGGEETRTLDLIHAMDALYQN